MLSSVLPPSSLLALALLQAPSAPTTYHLYVAAESSDQVYELAFDGVDIRTTNVIDVGYQATEVEGPHGLTVEPGGEHWYVTLSHGKPNGLLYKYRTGSNELVGSVELGLYPASIVVAGGTGLLYSVNFDLYGDMRPSSVSVVDVESMTEVARTVTGSMPHGSRLATDGKHHYSCAMMSDELIELDTQTFEVARRLKLDDGSGVAARARKGPKQGPEPGAEMGHVAVTKPTWVQPHPTERKAYVALNGAHQIVEVDLDAWKVTRRYPTGRGPYNLEVTPDGKRVVASYKAGRAVGVIELATGKELARVETTRRVPHAVVIPPDGRYAFVSCEGVGGEAGTVDVIDLESLARVASVEVGLQAGGLALWKVVTEERP
jgi:DNA-binding beta-propeller fold protein YncE